MKFIYCFVSIALIVLCVKLETWDGIPIKRPNLVLEYKGEGGQLSLQFFFKLFLFILVY